MEERNDCVVVIAKGKTGRSRIDAESGFFVLNKPLRVWLFHINSAMVIVQEIAWGQAKSSNARERFRYRYAHHRRVVREMKA